MTDADKVMNPRHSESDPADIGFQMWINLENWIHLLAVVAVCTL